MLTCVTQTVCLIYRCFGIKMFLNSEVSELVLNLIDILTFIKDKKCKSVWGMVGKKLLLFQMCLYICLIFIYWRQAINNKNIFNLSTSVQLDRTMNNAEVEREACISIQITHSSIHVCHKGLLNIQEI